MASVISAGTTSGTSLNLSGDTSGVLQLASNGSTTAVTIDTNQRAAFVAGTAALPAITTTGDTNTGIFFSAADTIDFAEGGVACGQFDSSANFKFNSGYGSVATAYGCRAWVNFNGTTNTGGFCTIRGSGNVTSVSDNGTGDYTVNFTSDMPDANFAHSGSGGKLTTGSIADIDVSRVNSSASNIRIETVRGSDNTVADFEYIAVAIFR